MEDQSSQAFKVVYNLVSYTIFEISHILKKNTIDCEFRICEQFPSFMIWSKIVGGGLSLYLKDFKLLTTPGLLNIHIYTNKYKHIKSYKLTQVLTEQHLRGY